MSVVFFFLFVLFHDLDLKIDLPLFSFGLRNFVDLNFFCAHDKYNFELSFILPIFKSINVLMKFAHIIIFFV